MPLEGLFGQLLMYSVSSFLFLETDELKERRNAICKELAPKGSQRHLMTNSGLGGCPLSQNGTFFAAGRHHEQPAISRPRFGISRTPVKGSKTALFRHRQTFFRSTPSTWATAASDLLSFSSAILLQSGTGPE